MARLAHVTVRTLHHYEEIGLLAPSFRTPSGYRQYTEADLGRLQQILLYRELDFSLEAIARLLDDPGLDRGAALRAQRHLLLGKKRRVEAVIRAVDRTLDSLEGGAEMSADDMFEGFEDLVEAPLEVRSHHREHAPEAHDRWGDTDAYRESMRRVKDYSKQDWAASKQEIEAAETRMAELLVAGAEPAGEKAMEGAEALRLLIERWFYPCSHAMHAQLADLYESDPRFRAHYEERAAGLATFVAEAIRANAMRAWDDGHAGG